jgi:hypothetical protein
MSAALINPDTGRLSVQTVERLHRLLGGDAPTEQMILDFISARWQARNLFYLPAKVAAEAIARPWDFIHAAKKFQTTDLPF